MNVDKDIFIEFFKSSPAWIALIIALITPIINKKLDIEKNNALFIFTKRYEIFTTHFNKLYEFRMALKNLLATLMRCCNEPDKDLVEILNNDINELYIKWEEVSLSEASLWLFAEYQQLNKKGDLLASVRHFYNKLNSLQSNDTIGISEHDVMQLITLGEEIQTPIAQILEYYRDTLNIKEISLKERFMIFFRNLKTQYLSFFRK